MGRLSEELSSPQSVPLRNKAVMVKDCSEASIRRHAEAYFLLVQRAV
jgi:hypothetical protein